MATTPNYGWVTPAPTDFVVDLPADFETFADAADATVKALNPGTTAGDLDYYTSGTAKARLGIGTAGQVLTVNSGATAPEWIALPTTTTKFTLLNAGGTALTGAATITVSGISNKSKILIIVSGASSASAQSLISIRLNTDTGNNYYQFGTYFEAQSTYSAQMLDKVEGARSNIRLAQMSNNAGSAVSGYVLLDGCTTDGVKIFNAAGSANISGSNTNITFITGGYYDSASTISSVSAFSGTGNFDAGTLFVYGA